MERREVEKRIYGERFRLTASVAFHGYRIIAEYDREINSKRTNYDLEIKIFLSFLFFRFFPVLRNLIRTVIQQRMVFLIHVQQDVQFL